MAVQSDSIERAVDGCSWQDPCGRPEASELRSG